MGDAQLEAQGDAVAEAEPEAGTGEPVGRAGDAVVDAEAVSGALPVGAEEGVAPSVGEALVVLQGEGVRDPPPPEVAVPLLEPLALICAGAVGAAVLEGRSGVGVARDEAVAQGDAEDVPVPLTAPEGEAVAEAVMDTAGEPVGAPGVAVFTGAVAVSAALPEGVRLTLGEPVPLRQGSGEKVGCRVGEAVPLPARREAVAGGDGEALPVPVPAPPPPPGALGVALPEVVPEGAPPVGDGVSEALPQAVCEPSRPEAEGGPLGEPHALLEPLPAGDAEAVPVGVPRPLPEPPSPELTVAQCEGEGLW